MRGRRIVGRVVWRAGSRAGIGAAAIVAVCVWAFVARPPAVAQPAPGPVPLGPSPLGPSAAAPSTERVSPVIFPPQTIPLAFSHVQHLRSPEPPACVDCHTRAATSQASIDNLIPRESACRPCHAIDRRGVSRRGANRRGVSHRGVSRRGASGEVRRESPAPAAAGAGAPTAECAGCHRGYDARTSSAAGFVARIDIPIPNIKFNHRLHADRGIGCSTCHGDLSAERVGLATRDQLPTMELCLGCHDGRRASDDCTTCHLADGGGFIRTAYASGALVPSGSLRGAAHDASFRTGHGLAARNDRRFCGSCHRESFCTECHAGVVKPMDFHGSDYISLHAIDARRNQPDCRGCHRLQSFCVGCHARVGITADGRGSEFDSADPARRYHPPGWADLGGRGPNHHAMQAQRNIASCVSCHREQFCVGCHTAQMGSMRINPHPRGWAGSRRCRALLARNKRVCLRCHVSAAELRCQ